MISDAAARSAALDPQRSFIVQAPAGSGKTELLTQRYLRLLATVESPEQILAITFTRKAAAEMRARILQALQSAEAPPPDSAHKRSTWELAKAVRAIDAERRWQLMQHPARLRIQTIDALNASLARRLPVIAGTGAALEPTTDMTPLYELAGRRLLERLGEGSPVSAHLEVLVMHLGNRVERLIQLLNDLLAKRDQWLHIVMHARASTDLRATLQATLT
ncbi:MAG TPA: UvrD-helicase domain-containing protein, partial [Steroidobacteraceae bacterium]|nr:UvrD-helicase domain-containing protein [Steroidobacteraceae bacterium]